MSQKGARSKTLWCSADWPIDNVCFFLFIFNSNKHKNIDQIRNVFFTGWCLICCLLFEKLVFLLWFSCRWLIICTFFYGFTSSSKQHCILQRPNALHIKSVLSATKVQSLRHPIKTTSRDQHQHCFSSIRFIGTERMADEVQKEKWMRTIDNRISMFFFFYSLRFETYIRITNSLKYIIFFSFILQHKRMPAIVERKKNHLLKRNEWIRALEAEQHKYLLYRHAGEYKNNKKKSTFRHSPNAKQKTECHCHWDGWAAPGGSKRFPSQKFKHHSAAASAARKRAHQRKLIFRSCLVDLLHLRFPLCVDFNANRFTICVDRSC